jgi:SulP family sulfate permease
MKLLPSIFAVTFIGYVGSVGLVLSFEHLQKGNRIETNKELFALGLAKLIGAFFQSIPSTGSFSRTAINVTAGAKTQISSLISVVLLCLTILFITPLFYYLPNAVLAAIITHSVLSLLRSEEIKIPWEQNKIEFIVFRSTFILTLLIGLEIGVVGGILLYYVLVKAVSYFVKPKKSLE